MTRQLLSLSALAAGLATALAACSGTQVIADEVAAAPAARETGAHSFVVFGDSGYIPAYESFDDDEAPLTTVEAYMEEEHRAWTKRYNTSEFKPSPMTFEASLGSYMPASGLYPVAWAMDRHCRVLGCQFAAMLGDNIYPDGATLSADGIADAKRFDDMFNKPFGRLGAGVPDFTIYAAMGNHDWRISRDATLAQKRYLQEHPNFDIPAYFYKVSPPATGGEVEIFMLDTEIMLAGTTVYKDALAEDGSGREVRTGVVEAPRPHTVPQTAEERAMADWLLDSLRSSTARWKLVMAHHPIWSGGGSKHEQARALRALIMPALCRYADAFFAGHEHTLEVHTDDCSQVEGALPAPLPQLVSGAAAKQRPLHPAFMRRQEKDNAELTTLWAKGMIWGFLHVTLQGDDMTVQVITTPDDYSGDPVVEAEYRFARRTSP